MSSDTIKQEKKGKNLNQGGGHRNEEKGTDESILIVERMTSRCVRKLRNDFRREHLAL